ncbi:hypothetical protein Lal_00036885 [Lupinus albus]|uniref:Putative transcriptional coactivator/pterin dehydratase n=1 Tax=Lupinus albus TaxID=3870 RepID=A0A6A4PTH4_LUPAL|nr:putative transcriptional coactivator/pterin dehydratase [Lupinus albus]KAF1888843.1 hypothetical protein Lal_00036885 [Lupinus albus]
MPLSLVQITFLSPLQQPSSYNLYPKSLFPSFDSEPFKRFIFSKKTTSLCSRTKTTITHASLIEAPVLWVGRICIFYALLKSGLAGSKANPLVSDLGIVDSNENDSGGDLGFSKWTQSILGKPAKEEDNGRKLVSKWHPTTKGTLRRNYRVPSKSEGRRLLKAIASLLSDDDHFVDATSHKGCQIRRESAHGESVCCNNVRALFDELPTPHLTVEITPFPFGPLSEKDYTKAEKLEKVLRSSPSV